MCCSAAHCHPMSAVPRSIFSHVCCAHPMTAHPSQPAAASCRACKKHRGRYCAPSGDHRCRNVAESPTCLHICCGTTCTPSHVQAAKLQPVHMLRKTLQANTRAARNSKCLQTSCTQHYMLHTTLQAWTHAAHNTASLNARAAHSTASLHTCCNHNASRSTCCGPRTGSCRPNALAGSCGKLFSQQPNVQPHCVSNTH